MDQQLLAELGKVRITSGADVLMSDISEKSNNMPLKLENHEIELALVRRGHGVGPNVDAS